MPQPRAAQWTHKDIETNVNCSSFKFPYEVNGTKPSHFLRAICDFGIHVEFCKLLVISGRTELDAHPKSQCVRAISFLEE